MLKEMAFSLLKNLYLKTEQSTKVILKMELDTVLAPKFGLMVLSTKVSGDITKLMVKVNSGMQMAMFTKDYGRTIKQMATVFIFMLMVLNMKDTGEMTYRMVPVLNHGAMAVNTRVVIEKV